MNPYITIFSLLAIMVIIAVIIYLRYEWVPKDVKTRSIRIAYANNTIYQSQIKHPIFGWVGFDIVKGIKLCYTSNWIGDADQCLSNITLYKTRYSKKSTHSIFWEDK
jgi:hypothetical protein